MYMGRRSKNDTIRTSLDRKEYQRWYYKYIVKNIKEEEIGLKIIHKPITINF